MLQEVGPLSELSVLNYPAKVIQGPKYLHHLVHQTDGCAIDFLEDGLKRRELTYAELHSASDRLTKRIGAHLERLEHASDVIPVLLPQSPELYIALLAVLKSGKAFCPIGLDSPPDRVAFILKDISADILITTGTLTHKLHTSSSVRALLVDSDEPAQFNPAGLATHAQRQTRLAYVLYTSGSTGLPKAVSVSHRAVTQSLLAHDRHIPSFSRFLQFAAPTFDVSIFEIFFTLYRGCTLVGCIRANMLNDLPATIASLRVDAAELTPTVVSNLLRGRQSVPGLKLLLTIGEMLTRDVVDEFGGTEERSSILWGMYGPTEAAIHCTLQPNFSCASRLGNIGFPLETVTTIIAAPASQGGDTQNIKILARGEVGELVIGGPQVADEYLNRPELTSASFIQDPEFGYVYRTGDKARLRSDGTLECLGRIASGQVKLKGQRVELGEIEETITRIDDCYSAATMVIEDALVAFCATRTPTVSNTMVQETCRKWLPSYMVPTDVMFVDCMPQLASGKIDRKSLEIRYLDKRYQSSFAAPQYNNEPNDPFKSIFQSIFGREIEEDEDFADLGLDSLRSIRIASAVREQGFDVATTDILSTTNLKGFKDLCKGKRKRHHSPTMNISIDPSRISGLVELQPHDNTVTDILLCTPLQEAMLAETAIRPNAYCNWIEIELDEHQTFPRIRELIGLLAQQNEILRTGFCMTNLKGKSFVQVIWKNMQPTTVVDATTFSKTYSLGSSQSLLHPFTVQVNTATERPRLLFQIHHALYDGWSFDLLLRDLNELLAGRLNPTRPQFSEVVNYYVHLFDSSHLARSADWWREALREYNPIPLPNFNGKRLPYSGLRSFRGEYAVDSKSFSASAKEYAIHPQVFYQSALSLVLSLYLGTSDVAIGTVTSGRTIPVTHVEDIMGPCIATLPFRVDLSSSTVGDLLQRTQQANRSMLEHCVLPLRDITKLCQLRPGERLFDVLFVWQESLISADNRTLALRTIDSADDLEFKITFELEPCEDNIAYRITYDPATIPEQQVKYLAKQIHHTAQYFLSHYDGELEEAKRFCDPEILSIANPKPKMEPIRHGLAHAVQEWAVKTPDKDAVVFGSIVDGDMRIKQRLSYASLNARANQLAHHLMGLGAANDQLVCVILDKSIDLYVSILAILKTGCGYLPIVPDTPAERVNRIIADADVKFCIGDSDIAKDIHQDRFVMVDLDKVELQRHSPHNLHIPYNGNHLAYAVFTSGSTGKPKGVLVTQDNLMSNLEYLASLYPYADNSRLLQSCSQAFDVSVFEIFFSWHVGISLCTATKDDLFFDFEAAIDRLDITHLSLTPTVAGLVDSSKVPKVEFLVTAGEALTEGVKRKWAGNGLYQGYGPSETTNICTVRPRVTDDDLINNIGPVFPNTSLLILEPGSNSIVARGAVGELCFGGAQVFRGYLNRSDLNAQKILEHPEYGRIYRSGDMGRLLPDGSILSTGRLDDQVKIRGQRVELGEITSLVLNHPFVHDCSTVLVENEPTPLHDTHHGGQRLVVFWVPESRAAEGFCFLPPQSHRPQILEIFESLSLQLPGYMIPTHAIPISRIPMTAQAKIDKRLLQGTFNNSAVEDLEFTSLDFGAETNDNVLSPPEIKIAEALSRTLSLPLADIKRSSSFFNIGLDSVSAIQFAKNLRDVGHNPPVSVILKNPTVERLALCCSQMNNTMTDTPKACIGSSALNVFDEEQLSQIRSHFHDSRINRILPCTPLQEAMLSAGSGHPMVHQDVQDKVSGTYYNVMTFAVNGDLKRLKESWERIVERHDILRTAFTSTDNLNYAFAQVILSHVPVTWDDLDASKDVRTYAGEVLSNLLRSHKPPVHLASQGHGISTRLVFCCHHALYDGVAIATLLDEVQKLYLEEELPKPVPYDVYLRHMVSPHLDDGLQFWTETLANYEPTYFPSLSSKVLKPSHTAGLVRRILQMPLSEVSKHCRDTSSSLLSLVQAAWAKLLHYVLADSDLCFGNVVSGRTLPEDDLDRLVAPCFNTLPVRVDFDFQRSNADLCKKLHTFNVDTLPFQLTPLRWIQSKTRQEHGRLFDTLVILQQPSAPLDHSIWDLEKDDGEMDLPVVCEVVQDKTTDTLSLSLHYQHSLCQADDTEKLAEIFDSALQSLIRFPNAAANDIVGLPGRLLGHSNIDFRALGAPDTQLLHSEFEKTATERPDAIALHFRHSDGTARSLTFTALNEKANQIAHYLIKFGIKPEDVVPVCMSKSPEFYMSILGVLKAGAAFSPIHPDLPEARKLFMVSELKPKVILALQSVIGWPDNTTVINVKETGDYPTENPCIKGLHPTNMAYCLYTSGSTGLPKAVSMEHRSPVQTIESSRSLVPWNANSRLLQYAAITFDMCYYDCFMAWTFGFTLCAADQDEMFNNLASSINALDVDLLDLTPSVAMSLKRSEVPNVKWLYCIGEAMTPEVVTEWEGACVNSYGPTEAAFCTTIFLTTPEFKTSIIGQPFPTTSFVVFPPGGERPLPVFGVGELYIGGFQLARGYFGQPELTEDRFVYKCGQRFYRSGDVVRMLSDGNFEFLGRTDDQVKIRGLRVELGEINKTLKDSDERIAAVATLILKMDNGRKDQLVAFIVLRPSTKKDERSNVRLVARSRAMEILPAYMVPQFFLFIDKIPMSMAGKIDRKELQKVFQESIKITTETKDDEQDASTYQWSECEECIRTVLEKLSGIPFEEIKPWTSIYQLGLDSISAVQVATALRKQGVQVKATDVMRYPSCNDLAVYLEHARNQQPAKAIQFDFDGFEQKHKSEIVRTCNILDEHVEAIRPCTTMQNGMLSQFIQKDGRIYFNYLRLCLDGTTDVDRLRHAWSATARTHRMLRTGFAHVKDNDTSFAMVHYTPDAVSLPWHTAIDSSGTTEEWLCDCEREAVRNLHIPPWRLRVSAMDNIVYLEVALLHAIFDAQSLRLFFDDVVASYNGKEIIAVPLEPVVENIIHSSNSDNTASNDFWKKAGKAAVPTHFPNLAPLRYDPAPSAVLVRSSAYTLEEFGEQCRALNTSLQVVGLASWATLLSAYVGESSVTFGVVLSGRNIDGADAAAFPCITTVPFACEVSGDQEEMLKKIMSLNANVQQHQFTPLNRIQKLMGYPNEPLFDSIFAFQKLADDGSADRLWTVVDERASIEYPVSIELEPRDGHMEFRLTYLPHIIPQEQADIILAQLEFLMEEYAFSRLGHQTFDHQHYENFYSISHPGTPTIPSEATLLHEFVELTAAKHPSRPAFEFATSLREDASQKWTYAQLDGEGNRIANLLISRGVRPGELVGVCFEKCPEASFAMLGILKAGCAFVALDPGAPSARKAFILKDSGAPVVLSMNAQSTSFKENTKATILNLDETGWQSASPKKPTLERSIDPQDRSYCLYTSGTTGTPKGCELTHENAVQAMQAFKRLFWDHWHDESRWLQFASFHFDVSVLEQYWSWSVGICVVSAPRDLIFEDLAASIRTLQITHIDLTPSLARILHPDDVPTLCKGVFITGGESLKQEILDVWGPKSVIYNGYGPTEATIGVTMYPRVPANGKPSNIGPQFDNVGSYVLRPGTDEPVLRGGVGELCVSGKLVGKGYLNRPNLTAERFPYLERFNERVYRTGDLVRILHDGTFDFLGRADDQVKLRGQRLEIGEINSVIKQCGITVADVVTLVLKHPKQQKEQLVSFIVMVLGTRSEPKILLEETGNLRKAKEACQEKLPPYMVPTHFVALTAMPLSANNKAEVRKLKEMYEALFPSQLQLLSSGTQARDEQWTTLEERVRDVLKETLDIADSGFSKDTNFFELGMDSISVIGVSKALKQAGFQEATASVVLKNSTVRRLAKSLSQESNANNDKGSAILAQQAIIAVQHRHRRAVAETLFTDTRNIEVLAPCTPLQQGMIARSFESEHGLYFNSFHFELRKGVDMSKIGGAWNRAFASIQVLRTAFVNTDNGFVQAVLRDTQLPFYEVTLAQDGVLETHLTEQRDKWVGSNQTHIKNPLQVLVIETPNRRLLVLHIFHGLYDGNSIGMVFKAAWDAYHARVIETGPPFHSTLAYGPLRRTIDAQQFWGKYLADQRFRPLPSIQDQQERSVTVTREVQDLPNLEVTRRKLNVTAQAIAQGCWVVVLHQYLKATVTLGMVVSGRSIDFEDADKVIGPLFNTIPFQYHAKQHETWASVVTQSHVFNIASQPYQHTPLRDILKWMKRSPGQPLFDTLFVYQAAEENEQWARNELWELQDSGAEADYPLAIEVEQRSGGGLKLTIVAQTHVMDLELATRFLERYAECLRQAIEEPNTVLETFVVASEESANSTLTNGTHIVANTLDDAINFRWTKHAVTIRQEVAELSGVEVEEVKANTSIFELGLDSIDAIKLSSKLKKHGIELPVSAIMRSLNIVNMTRHIDVGKVDGSTRPSDMIYRATKKHFESYLRRHGLTEGVEQVLPLTPLQEAMIAEMTASEYTRYYNHDVLKLKPGIDIQRLKEAWTEVVKESPILRTAFIPVDDPSIDFSHAQVVYDRPHDFWNTTLFDHEPDFPAIFDSVRDEAVSEHSSRPPFQVYLVQSPQEAYLVLSIAHALYDGWSLGLLHSDVHQAYTGNLRPRPSYEPALHEILTASGPGAAAFWRDYLSEATSGAFPGRAKSSSGTVYRKQQSSLLSLDAVTSFAKNYNITLQTLGQAVHGMTVGSYTKSLDVTFGSVLSGRDDESRSRLLFPVMNTVAVRTILHGSRRDMLQYVQENFSNIKQWQHFPLRKALSLAGAQGSLLQSLFIYQKTLNAEVEESDKLYESIQGQSDVEYPICVEMEVVGKELVWRCAVKEEVFNEADAQELLDRLDGVLNALITRPDAPVINFTADGTSICGLPAFADEQKEDAEEHTPVTYQKEVEHSASPTAGIIREVLAFVSQTPEEEITANMTIFHIGLDSISAIKVSSLLRKRGVTLSVGEMLRAGTVERMTHIVDERMPTIDSENEDTTNTLAETISGIDQATVLSQAGIKEEDVERLAPATAGQIYMLSTWVNSQGAVFYPEFNYRLHGSLSFEAIREAWQNVVARNTILRTCFYTAGGKNAPYIQVIMRNAEASVTDLTCTADELSTGTKAKTAAEQPYTHLFLSKSTLSDTWDLRLKIHHALYDGISLPLLISQFQDLCMTPSIPAPVDALAKLIATTSTSSAVQQRKSFWTYYLKDLHQNHLSQHTISPTSRIEVFKPGLLPSVTDLESQAHKHGLTAQSLLLAVYAKLYADFTATPYSQDVVIGIYLANRSLPIANIHQAPIPTVNLVPLRVSAPLETNVFDVAAQIQYDIQEISAPANATVGLWEIREWTGIAVDTFVNFLKLPAPEGDSDGENGGIKIEMVEQWNEGSSKVVDVETVGAVPPKEMVNGRVNGAYLHALDIEATIRSGALDVGVFAPKGMVGLEEGEKLVKAMKRELEGVAKATA